MPDEHIEGELTPRTLAALSRESGRKHRNAGAPRRRKYKQSAKRRAQKRRCDRQRRAKGRAAYNASQAELMQRRRDAQAAEDQKAAANALRMQLAKQGVFIVSSGQLRAPLLKRSDGHRLTHDDERTAEQVIADWLKTQKLPGALQ